MDRGFHKILYRFSPDDYKQISEIWNGDSAITGEPREVHDGPPEGGEVPDLTLIPPMFAPGANAEDIAEIAKRLG
jgi:Mn-containing catalase